MRQPEGGCANSAFIGRHHEREQIKTRLLNDGGVLLLFGQPLVGKASLALQVAEELKEQKQEEEDGELFIYTVDCKDAVDWPDVMCAMCRAFSLEDAMANENLLVRALLQRMDCSNGAKCMLLLLRAHKLNATGSDVKSMTRCLQSLATNDVMSIVTSRRQLYFPSVVRIGPLVLDDAMSLLRHHSPDVTATEFQRLLKEYCHGLPPLVLQMAQLVGGETMLAYSATELSEALQDDPGLLMKDLDREAISLFTSLSPHVQHHVTNLANLLEGSFSQEALQAVVGVEGSRVKAVMRILHEEAPLIIDNQSRRMRIEPLLLHHIRKLGHIATDDQARLRVVKLLGQVLTKAERDLYVKKQDAVYGHLHCDWPSLQHVLRQAIHCTGNTYHAYMQVALQADKLLAKCFPGEALTFYKNMAGAAVRFGTSREQAVLQGLVGMALTQGQAGTGWEEALQHFRRAMPVLEQEPQSPSYLRLLCDMGNTHFRLNQLQEADRFLHLAVTVSRQWTHVEDERELIFHVLRARNLLALPAIFRGHYNEGEELLRETLELCGKLAPNHPDKPMLINSLGLIYERSGKNQDLALQYYRQSLVERRRYQEVAPGDLVPTLNNVGMQYSRRGQFREAMEHLQEAREIRARDNRWHYFTALTEQHMGQVALQMGDYKCAQEHLAEAACVYARCTPHHDVRAKVSLTMAHLYVTDSMRDVTQAKKYLQEVCELTRAVDRDLSDSGLVVLMSAIQHLVQLEGWVSAAVTSLLTWAQELLSKFDGDPSEQLSSHQAIIQDMVAMIPSDVTEARRDNVTSRITQQCQMCGYLATRNDMGLLWRRIEAERGAVKSAVKQLQNSPAINNVLKKAALANNPPSSSSSQPASAPESFDDPMKRSQAVQRMSQLNQIRNADSRSPGVIPLVGEAVGRERDAGQDLIRNNPLREEEMVGQGGGFRDPTSVQTLLVCSENLNPGTAPTNQLRNLAIGQAFGNSVRLENYPLNQPDNLATDVGFADSGRLQADELSSCSMTSSNPNSASSLEPMSTGSSDSASGGQGARGTFLQRGVVYRDPTQETARDQNLQPSLQCVQGNLGYTRDQDLQPPLQRDQGNSGYFAVRGSGETEAGLIADSGGYNQAVGETRNTQQIVASSPETPAALQLAVQATSSSASQEPGLEREQSRTSSMPDSMFFRDLTGGVRTPIGRGSGHPGEGLPIGTSQAVASQVFNPLPTSHYPALHPAQTTQYTASKSFVTSQALIYNPFVTSQSSDVNASVTSQSPVFTSPVMTTTSSESRPEPTLQGVVTCAKQLVAVISPGGLVTSEQRQALEKLASGVSALDITALRNLKSLGDQAAKLSCLQEQGSGSQPHQRDDLNSLGDQAPKLNWLQEQGSGSQPHQRDNLNSLGDQAPKLSCLQEQGSGSQPHQRDNLNSLGDQATKLGCLQKQGYSSQPHQRDAEEPNQYGQTDHYTTQQPASSNFHDLHESRRLSSDQRGSRGSVLAHEDQVKAFSKWSSGDEVFLSTSESAVRERTPGMVDASTVLRQSSESFLKSVSGDDEHRRKRSEESSAMAGGIQTVGATFGVGVTCSQSQTPTEDNVAQNKQRDLPQSAQKEFPSTIRPEHNQTPLNLPGLSSRPTPERELTFPTFPGLLQSAFHLTVRPESRREPTENEDPTSSGHSVVSVVGAGESCGGGDSARGRQPMENDERAENPGHVCTSVNCTCSRNA